MKIYSTKRFVMAGGDPSLLWSAEVWRYIYQKMKAQGFAYTSAESVKAGFERVCARVGSRDWWKDAGTWQEWNKAITEALGAAKKRVDTQKGTKEFQDQYKNVNWSVVRQLGYTGNLLEAGYITPDGKLVNLSGGGPGRSTGVRGDDHRIVGGTAGMQEFISAGYIRIDASAGMIDVRKSPTRAQYSALASMLAQMPCARFYVDLERGLGQWDDRGMYYWRGADWKHLEYENKQVYRAAALREIMGYWGSKP